MKKLNRKGFTLIELLAVIVILAIILVVAVPQILQTTSNAKVSSIHNTVTKVATNYNTVYISDMTSPTPDNRVLGNIPESVTSTWKCIGDIKDTTDASNPKKLSDILEISENDFIMTGTVPPATITDETRKTITSKDGAATCSAIRMTNGKAEIILVAKPGGRFYVSQQYTYAISTDDAGSFNKAS